MPHRSIDLRAIVLAAALPSVGLLSGCYRHVVSARGPNAGAVSVHEANLKNERIPLVDDVEDAVFGKTEAPGGK